MKRNHYLYFTNIFKNTILFMKTQSLFFGLIFLAINAFSQSKKSMDPSVYTMWKRISNPAISNDGKITTYQLTAEENDNISILYNNSKKEEILKLNRTKEAKLLSSTNFYVYTQILSRDSVKNLKRLKTKKEDFPQDTLVIYNLKSKSSKIIDRLLDYKVHSEEDFIAYRLKPKKVEKDTSKADKDSKKVEKDSTKTEKEPIKEKKENDENGYHLIVKNLDQESELLIPFVTEYIFSKKGFNMIIKSNGNNDLKPGYYSIDLKKMRSTLLLETKCKSEKTIISENGQNAAFIFNADTTKSLVKSFELWSSKNSTPAQKISFNNKIAELHLNGTNLTFNEQGNKLFYGLNPAPPLKDTTLLEEEISNLDLWYTGNPKLYTMELKTLDTDKNKSLDYVYDLEASQSILLNTMNFSRISYPKMRKFPFAIGLMDNESQKEVQWNGSENNDIYKIDLNSGNSKLIQKNVDDFSISENGTTITWFDKSSKKQLFYLIKEDKITELPVSFEFSFIDEEHDLPELPGSYRFAGWTKNDDYIWMYDRYDIWQINPKNPTDKKRLTKGREIKTIYRLITLDPEEESIDLSKDQLLHITDEKTKDEGYAHYNAKSNQITTIIREAFAFSSRPLKAKNDDRLLFYKNSSQLFPDLLLSDTKFSNNIKISDANPQQKDYIWNKSELISWTNPKGEKLNGIITKPENFDPKKKYPMIVYFYEKLSQTLHSYKAPAAGGSSINISYYANKGYVIFQPDITYEIGDPGSSCYDDIISGTQSVIAQGYIDEKRIGIQGHSWGGYQVAYLVTKTNMFKCAESGAPVVNMTSAYGGIRWGSGMSRMFQYEKTQTRIGRTLWEAQQNYLDNSPLFSMDKVNTPILILHNDDDNAVPWYQGIEYFMALRRLNKEAWLLNYNGEPHSVVKFPNRVDFNIRMEQFFDHYLMDKPKPMWMQEGIKPTLKGINKGFNYK
jgi:dipeptidyl aminopeptidase/acylaminoacyl peptidase